jgi:hypothetical protein
MLDEARQESGKICRGARGEFDGIGTTPGSPPLASAGSLLPWFPPPQGVPMGTTDHRDILLVAGEDPYAFRGIADVMHPHIRPDGEGGCIR